LIAPSCRDCCPCGLGVRAAMVRIGVLFEVDFAETRHGEGVCVLGSRPELGSWDSKFARSMNLQLRTSAVMYPRWATFRPIWLELLADEAEIVHIEYKYVIHRAGSQVRWEDSIPNRSVELPVRDGSLWLVSDECWCCSSASAAVSSISAIEITERWLSFNPESFDPAWMPAERRRYHPAELVESRPDPPSELVESRRDLPAESVESKQDPPVEVAESRQDPPVEFMECKQGSPSETSFFALTPDDSSESGSHEEEAHPIVEEFSVLATPTSEAIASLQSENAMLRERVRSLSATLECFEQSAERIRPPEMCGSSKPSQSSEAEQQHREDDLLRVPQLGLGEHADERFLKMLASRLRRAEESCAGEEVVALAFRALAREILDIQHAHKSEEASATKEDAMPCAARLGAGDIGVVGTQLSAGPMPQLQMSDKECGTEEGLLSPISQSSGGDPSSPVVLSQDFEARCLRKEDITPPYSKPSAESSSIADTQPVADSTPRLQSSEENCHKDEGFLDLVSQSAEHCHKDEGTLDLVSQSQENSHQDEGTLDFVSKSQENCHKDDGTLDLVSQSSAVNSENAERSAMGPSQSPNVDGVCPIKEHRALFTPRSLKGDRGKGDDCVPVSTPRGLLALRPTAECPPKEDRSGKADSGVADAQLSILLAQRFEKSEKSCFTNEEMTQSSAKDIAGERPTTLMKKQAHKVDRKHSTNLDKGQLSVLLAQRRRKLEEGMSCEQHGSFPSTLRSVAGGMCDTQRSAAPGLSLQAGGLVACRSGHWDARDTQLTNSPQVHRQSKDPATSQPLSRDISDEQLGDLLAKRRQKLEQQSRVTSRYAARDFADTHRSALIAMRRQKGDGDEALDDCKKGGGFFRKRWLQTSPFESLDFDSSLSAKIVDEPQEEPQIEDEALGG